MDYQWQLVTADTQFTDDVGQPVILEPASRGVNIYYADTHEPVPDLKRHQRVYLDYREHDILAGDENIYIRERPMNYAFS